MILLDTHTLLWLRFGEARLGARTRAEIQRAWDFEELCLSAFSFWEIGMLREKGRIEYPDDVPGWRRVQLAQGIIEIPVDGAIAARAGLLPALRGDPADRIIVATAMEGHTLITADEHLLDWPGDMSRLDART